MQLEIIDGWGSLDSMEQWNSGMVESRLSMTLYVSSSTHYDCTLHILVCFTSTRKILNAKQYLDTVEEVL